MTLEKNSSLIIIFDSDQIPNRQVVFNTGDSGGSRGRLDVYNDTKGITCNAAAIHCHAY